MDILKRLLKAQLFKVSSLNALSILIKMGIGLVASKVIAVFVGPSGLGLVGNMRNFLSFIETWGTLGFQQGIVKYSADYKDDKAKISALFSTVFALLFIVLGLIGGLLFVFSSAVSDYVFGVNFQYESVVQILAFVLPFYIFSLIFLAFLNGLGDYNRVLKSGIWGNVIGLFVSVGLIYYYQTFGALVALVTTPALLFGFTLYYLQKHFSVFDYFSWKYFDFDLLKKLLTYALMFFVPAVIGPLVNLQIRINIIDALGNHEAGYWEAISRISIYYLMFVTTLGSVYFFPRLSVTKSVHETRDIFYSYYRWIIPVFSLSLVIIYFLRKYIVLLLFTSDFTVVNDLFFWQLLGDFFKALSLILGYQLLAKKMLLHFLVTEIISLLIMYFASSFFIHDFKIEGVVMAHTLTYVVYLSILLVVFRRVLFSKVK